MFTAIRRGSVARGRALRQLRTVFSGPFLVSAWRCNRRPQ